MATKDELDAAQLADTYEALGELAGRHDARVTLAKRKADGLPVLITTYREPEGDAGNALSHLASDAKILEGHSHPSVVRVLESRWVGNHALAIVTERVPDASLEDRLSRREEEFPFPRIATLLREVNAVLAWAREQGLVHRALRPDLVFVADGSDHPKVMFSAAALPANGIPDERDDARTIATLARAMLTRSVADPERDQLPLAELRPGLPGRVIAQTEALLGRADSLEPVDVRAYIAAIAMAEELKLGEDETARVTREMSEEQRLMREALAAERKAHEEDLEEQARQFGKERDDILRAMAKEREEAARALAKEREDSEKALRQERERLEKEIRKQRALLAREQKKLERERESFERERAKAREQIAAKLAALRAQADLYSQTAELPAVLEEPFHEPEGRLAPESEPLAAADAEPFDEVDEETVEERAGVADAPPPLAARAAPRMPSPSTWRTDNKRRHRLIGVAAVALLLVIAAAALAFSRRGNDGIRSVAGQSRVELRVVDSLGGASAPLVMDSIADSAAAVAEPASRRASRPRPARVEPPVTRDTVVAQDTMAPIIPGMPMAVRPAPPAPLTRTDSLVRPDSVRRDSSMRRDTTERRDTTVRRDTVASRPDIPSPRGPR